MKAVACWNAFIDANSHEPQTGTQFQRWVAHSFYRDDISYNKAFDIYDQYHGSGKVNYLPPGSGPQSTKSSHSSDSRKNQWDGNYFHQTQQQQQYNNNAQPPMNNNNNQKQHVQFQNNIPQQNKYIFNQQQQTYQPFDNQRSRTRSAYSDPSQNNHLQNPQHFNIKPKNNNEQRSARSKTVSTRQDLTVFLPPNNLNQMQGIPELPKATRHIKANSMSPKVADNIMPKDGLTVFLIANDIKDLKRTLKEHQIELKHLQSLEANDLNELCADLKLTSAQKIRFKHAVKELQKQNAHKTAVPVPSAKFSSYNNMNARNRGRAKSALPSKNRNNRNVFNKMYKLNQQTQPNQHYHTQTVPIQMSQQVSVMAPQNVNNQFGLMQSQAIKCGVSPDVANIAEETAHSFPGITDEKMHIPHGHFTPSKPAKPPMQYGHSADLYNINRPYVQYKNNQFNNHNHNHHHTQTMTATITFAAVPHQNEMKQDHNHNPYAFVPPAPAPAPRSTNRSTMAAAKKPKVAVAVSAKKTHPKQRRNSIGSPATPRGHNVWREWNNQWTTLVKESGKNNTEILAQSLSACYAMKECCCIKRIVFFMRFYAKFQNKDLDLHEIVQAINLKQYSIIDLLNDHYHILEFHRQKDAHFEFIFKQMTKIKPCAIKKCSMMKRNVLSKYNNYVLLHRGLDSMDDIIQIQLLDKLHCSYFHCYDLYRFSKQENEKLQRVSENNTNSDILHNEYYKMADIFMNVKHSNLKQIKGTDYPSLDDKVTKYSTKYDNSQNNHIYGYKYIYNMSQFQNEAKTSDIKLAKAKHFNLKQEILNNELVSISKKDWDITLRKCEKYYFPTNNIKKLINEQDVDVEPFICLYFFVNFDHFRQRLKATYFGDECVNHANFVCFAKILSNAVSEYGMVMEKYHFYHGLVNYNNGKDKEIILKDIYLTFHCPILATSRFEVIHNYQQYIDNSCSGIILNLTNCGLKTKFIDSTWFKNMESEREQILFGSNVDFRIVSVINLKTFANYYVYLHSIYIMQCILLSKDIPFALTIEEAEVLVKLIQSVVFPQNRIHSGYDLIEMFKLFQHFCHKQSKININMAQLLQIFKQNKFLLNFFVNDSKGICSLNIENIQKMFVNISSMTISSHYLNKKIMTNMLRLCSMNSNDKKSTKIKLQCIELNDILLDSKNKNDNLCDIVLQFQTKFESIGFRLEMDYENANKLILSKENYFGNFGFEINEQTPISVTMRDPKFITHSMAIDYSTMDLNTYQQDLYQIKLKLRNNQLLNVDKSYNDLINLHSFMTKKRKGKNNNLKIKSKLPYTSSQASKQNKNRAQIKRMEKKIESYLKYLIKIVLKHENAVFKKELYKFFSSSH